MHMYAMMLFMHMPLQQDIAASICVNSNILQTTYFLLYCLHNKILFQLQKLIQCSAEDTMEKQKITVRINGKNYTLIHDESDEYVHKVAHYLNSKISTASKGGIQLGEPTVIVMAALDITDELFKAKKNFNTLKNEIKRMMDEYDRLKVESHELEDQLEIALKQNEELKRKIHLLENK